MPVTIVVVIDAANAQTSAMPMLLTLSVVASSRAVGTLLAFGLLVAPPATAVLIVRRLPLAMLVSVGLGSLTVVAGLVVSYHADTAASATIAGIAVAKFFRTDGD